MDVRRIWRCSKCGKTVRTPGLVTAQRCNCSDDSQWMRLEPPVKREPFLPPHREPLPEPGDEEEVIPAANEPSTSNAEQPPAAEPGPPRSDPESFAATAAPPDVPVPDSATMPHPPDQFGAGLPGLPEQEMEPRIEHG